MKVIFCLWNSTSDTKKGSLLRRTGISKVKSKNNYVPNSRYIISIPYDINHVKSRYIQDPIKTRVLRLINNGSLLLLVYENLKQNVHTYSTQHTLTYNTTPYNIYQLKSRAPIFDQSTYLRPYIFTNKKIGRHPSYIILK